MRFDERPLFAVLRAADFCGFTSGRFLRFYERPVFAVLRASGFCGERRFLRFYERPFFFDERPVFPVYERPVFAVLRAAGFCVLPSGPAVLLVLAVLAVCRAVGFGDFCGLPSGRFLRFAERPALSGLPTGRFWPVCRPAGPVLAGLPTAAGFSRFWTVCRPAVFCGLLTGRFLRFVERTVFFADWPVFAVCRLAGICGLPTGRFLRFADWPFFGGLPTGRFLRFDELAGFCGLTSGRFLRFDERPVFAV